jgi:hypothetical protein
MPNNAQLRGLYRLTYWLTFIMVQPVYLVCMDARTNNLYILARDTENLEFQIALDGEVF